MKKVNNIIMDIPYYEYIYDFPGGHNQVPPQHSHTHLTLTHAIETSKEVKLFDAIGNIRYIVKLCSTETDEGLAFLFRSFFYLIACCFQGIHCVLKVLFLHKNVICIIG